MLVLDGCDRDYELCAIRWLHWRCRPMGRLHTA